MSDIETPPGTPPVASRTKIPQPSVDKNPQPPAAASSASLARQRGDNVDTVVEVVIPYVEDLDRPTRSVNPASASYKVDRMARLIADIDQHQGIQDRKTEKSLASLPGVASMLSREEPVRLKTPAKKRPKASQATETPSYREVSTQTEPHLLERPSLHEGSRPSSNRANSAPAVLHPARQ